VTPAGDRPAGAPGTPPAGDRPAGARGPAPAAPRVAPGGRREVGRFAWAFSHLAGRVSRTTPPNLFLTLGRRPKLFRAWLRFAGRLMPRGTLPRRESELVILRVAHLRACAYEWEHHVRIGARAGVGPEDVARVQEGPAAPGWSARERALLNAVDELDRDGDLTDAAWSALREHYDEGDCVELCLLAGHYEMLATTIIALRIQPDRPRPR
jgi:AhpD family alkylhydroperoxidase